MDEAEYCDRIAIMDKGVIVVLDTPDALKASVGHDRVSSQTDDDAAAIAALAERFEHRGARSPRARSPSASPEGEQFVPRLFAELGVPIRSVSVSRPSLDDVFMSYTGTTIRDAEAQRQRAWAAPPTAASGAELMASATTRPSGHDAGASACRSPRVRVPPSSLRGDLRAVKIVWQRELIRFSKDRLRIVTSLVQPFLFLFVLGTGLSRLASAGTHGVNLRTFVYPGVLCMAVLFTAMFSAASLVWDREFGFLREMMVAPVRRSSLVLGKCLGGATVASFQGIIVLGLAGTVGVPYAPRAPARGLRAADGRSPSRSPPSA